MHSRLNAQYLPNYRLTFSFRCFEVRVLYRRKKSSRSLSHLLMSSCFCLLVKRICMKKYTVDAVDSFPNASAVIILLLTV